MGGFIEELSVNDDDDFNGIEEEDDQVLNEPGGVKPISDISYDGKTRDASEVFERQILSRYTAIPCDIV